MAENNNRNPFAFTPTVLRESTERRRVIRQLPDVHDTETLGKFFGSTADHLFNPGEGNQLAGYVGRRPLWNRPDQDYYVGETSPSRQFYQLEPGMVSRDSEGDLANLLTYPDLVNQIRAQGGVTENQDRLFSQSTYTWCPPIDLDKFLNFRQYVWLGDDSVEALEIHGPSATRRGDGQATQFPLPGRVAGEEDLLAFYDVTTLRSGLIQVRVDGQVYSHNYDATNNRVVLSTTPPQDSEVVVSVSSDFRRFASGLAVTDPRAFGGVNLSTGQRIRLPLDQGPDLRQNVWIVEGVGRLIHLVPETTGGQTHDHMVIERGSNSHSEWSVGNRWFHINTLPADQRNAAEAKRATRPIIEFSANLELHRYGTYRRLPVDLVVRDVADLGQLIQGQTSLTLSGVEIAIQPAGLSLAGLARENVRILVLGSDDDLVNDRVYALINQNGAFSLIVEADGQDPSGEPVEGEVMLVSRGPEAGENIHWNGGWTLSQRKTQTNQPPLFALFDHEGVALDDPAVYPSSTFRGSRLFGYRVDGQTSRPIDPTLGIAVTHDDRGQILFENFQASERHSLAGEEITGFYYTRDDDQLSNSWWKRDLPTRQWVVDHHVSDGRSKLFKLSQNATQLTISLGRTTQDDSYERLDLVEDRDFIRLDQDVMIMSIQKGDVVEIRTLANTAPDEGSSGFYETPENLVSNPNNQEVTTVSKGDVYDHLTSILRSQDGFLGAEYSVNNFRDTARDPSKGGLILQHTSGLLKTMLLASDPRLDVLTATRYAQDEYTRMINKFRAKALDLVTGVEVIDRSSQRLENLQKLLAGEAVDDDAIGGLVDEVLERINSGKTSGSPFHYSKMGRVSGGAPTYLPSTPSWMGLHPISTPRLTNLGDLWYLTGHDGSVGTLDSELVAQICLELEKRIIASIPSQLLDRSAPLMDHRTIHGLGGWYTGEEWKRVLRPSFERWCADNYQDYTGNDQSQLGDPWSWNWSSQGQPGHWRAIYQSTVGTFRPDLTPWEALGFSIQPGWWEDRYGPAPYTSENLTLWSDLEAGYIHAGDRKGTHAVWSHPGLGYRIPVDNQGQLLHPGPKNLLASTASPVQDLRWLPDRQAYASEELWQAMLDDFSADPVAAFRQWSLTSSGQPSTFVLDEIVRFQDELYICRKAHQANLPFADELALGSWEGTEVVRGSGTCAHAPLAQERLADWTWGDMGAVELSWRLSSSYGFACVEAMYLTRPAELIEMGWDTENLIEVLQATPGSQLVNQLTANRPRNSQLLVHGETHEGEVIHRVGVQQWISDLLVSRNIDVKATLGAKIRGLNSQLCYKMSGFTDSSSLEMISDSFGRIPGEDIDINLYRSPSIREEFYGGVMLTWTGQGYQIYGYDVLSPYFNLIRSSPYGQKISLGGGASGAVMPTWTSNIYYAVNITIKYGAKFYRCIRTHTSSTEFEEEFWTQVARPQYADGTRLEWSIEDVIDPQVSQLAYGSVLRTPQAVADFLNGYDRYLRSRGWVFDDLSEDGLVKDWREALVSFITWSNDDEREEGDYLTLSPSGQGVHFRSSYGSIQPIEQVVNGLYSIVDQQSQPIDHRYTRVVRGEDDVRVTCDLEQSGIYGLRLSLCEVEHVVVLSNRTIFNDVIYDPLLAIHQPRLRLQGFRSRDWKGRLDAPGYVITGDTIVPNFEKSADDFRRLFDIEAMETRRLQGRARANFGYEEKEYLNNLLLTPTNQFEFYQGMIQQKGSATSMRRLLRSNFIRHNKGLRLFEEWAFRVGDFGGQENTPSLDVRINRADISHDPQLIEFQTLDVSEEVKDINGVVQVTDITENGVVESFDSRWDWRPGVARVEWPARDFQPSELLPTAGYVKSDEVRFTLLTRPELDRLYGNQLASGQPVKAGDRVWIYGMDQRTPEGAVDLDAWTTYKFTDTDYEITDSLTPSVDGQGQLVILNKTLQGWREGDRLTGRLHISQPRTRLDDLGHVVSGEELIIEGLSSLNLLGGQIFTPRFRGKITVDLLANELKSVMTIHQAARQLITDVKVKVLTGSQTAKLSVGTNLHPQLVTDQLGGVDLTTPGTYDVSRPGASLPVELLGESIDVALDDSSGLASISLEISYAYLNAFELCRFEDGQLVPIQTIDIEAGRKIWAWTPARYESIYDVPETPGLWKDGDIIEVDSTDWSPGRWSVYRRKGDTWGDPFDIPEDVNVGWDGDPWDTFRWDVTSLRYGKPKPLRHQSLKIDSSLLDSAALYDDRGGLRSVLQLLDPAKGFIPGVADREISYRGFKDPANYGDGREKWDAAHEGELWWDYTNTRYLDYEISDEFDGGSNYKWANWGRIAPQTSVEIYEWVRSPVSPAGWNGHVASRSSQRLEFKPSGTVLDGANTPYVETTEWNDEIQTSEQVYYFWVLNPSVTPRRPSRRLSAQQVSLTISNIKANDLSFFAVVGRSEVIVGGVEKVLGDEDSSLKIKWNINHGVTNSHHKQWALIREGDERDTITDQLWSKMRDSLVGWDAAGNQVPDARLPRPQQLGSLIRPRQSWYPSEDRGNGARPSRLARQAFVDEINDMLRERPFADEWLDWQELFESAHLPPTNADLEVLDLADLQGLLSDATVVAGKTILIRSTKEAGGFWTLWKVIGANDTREFVLQDCQRWRLTQGELWDLRTWYAQGWSEADYPTYQFGTAAQRDAHGVPLISLLKGTLVRLDQQSPSDLRWSWDVYKDGEVQRVAKQDGTIEISQAFSDEKSKLFDETTVKAILDRTLASRIRPSDIGELGELITGRDGSVELEIMVNHLRGRLLSSLQRNRLFFAMVKSAFRQSHAIDWAFKTSFLYLGGYSEVLRQNPVAFRDQISDVLSYLEEVKPYHVKIREYVRRLGSGTDLARLSATDFDKPVLSSGGVTRVLQPGQAADDAILQSGQWRHWSANHALPVKDVVDWDAEWNGVRRLSTRIKLDRVSCGAQQGWDTQAWAPSIKIYSQLSGESQDLSTLTAAYRSGATAPGANFYRDQKVQTIQARNDLVRKGVVLASRPGTIVSVVEDDSHYMWSGSQWIRFEALGWDEEPDMGSWTRIQQSYQPTLGMPGLNDPALIAGCEFSGTTVQGGQDDWQFFDLDDQVADQVQGGSGRQVPGGSFTQPGMGGGHPHELAGIRPRDNLLITVRKSTGPTLKVKVDYRARQQATDLVSAGLTFKNWDQSANTVLLGGPAWTENAQGYTPLHDPQNPSTGYARDVVASRGYYSSSNVNMTTSGVKTFKLRDVADVDSIPSGLRGDDVRVMVMSTKDPSKRAVGVLQNSKGSEKNWDGQLVINFGADWVNLGSHRSWSIVPVDVMNDPGVVWIGNARFSYTGLTRSGSDITLVNARLSSESLGCLNITGSTVALRTTTPVFDGSRAHRRDL